MLSSDEASAYTKKERLTLQRERDKLDRSLGGIKDMGGLPDLMFVIDTNKEDIAIKEARRLDIPGRRDRRHQLRSGRHHLVVPGNDDAGRAISLYCDLIARAAIDGISRAQGDSGVDLGAAESSRRGRARSRQPEPRASSPCPVRAASPTISRSSPACRAAIEKKLNDLGIFHYWQLAELDHEAAHKVGEEVGLPAASMAGSPRPRNSPRKRNDGNAVAGSRRPLP